MKILLMVGFALLPVVWGLVQYWWLPLRREQDLERRLSKVHDPREAGLMVAAALSETKREAQFRREQRERDTRFL